MKKLIIFISVVIGVSSVCCTTKRCDKTNTTTSKNNIETVSIKGIINNPFAYGFSYMQVKDTNEALVSEFTMDSNGYFEATDIPKGTYRLVFAWSIDSYTDTIITIDSVCDFDTLNIRNNTDLHIADHYIWQRQLKMPTPDYSDFYREIYIDYRKTVDSLNEELQKRIEDRGASFEDFVDTLNDIENVNVMLTHLKDISLKPGYVLDIFHSSNWGNGLAHYYCRKTNEPKLNKECSKYFNDNILNYMNVDFTPEGIWSAFLLNVSKRYLFKSWHTYYFESWHVFSVEDEILHSVSKYDKFNKDLWQKLNEVPPIKNKIKIINSDNASITYYYWSEWKGLVEEKVHVKRIDETVQFIHYNKEKPDPRTSYKVLVPYNCGVMF